MNYAKAIKDLISDLDRRLWIEAAKSLGLDPEDHENDDEIQPIFERLKRQAVA